MRFFKLKSLPAILLALFTALSVLSPALTKPVQAAGETYTWTSFTQITATGGNLARPAIFTRATSPLNGSETFIATDIVHSSGCTINFTTLSPTSPTTMTVVRSATTGAAPVCSTAIQDAFFNTATINVGGTRPGVGTVTETLAQQAVTVNYIANIPFATAQAVVVQNITRDTSTGAVVGTITFNKQSLANPGDTLYVGITHLTEGTYANAGSLFTSAAFTKVKTIPLLVQFGASTADRQINVTLNATFINATTATLPAVALTLKKNGVVIATQSTAAATSIASGVFTDPGTGQSNVSVAGKASFSAVDPGDYQVCTPNNTCQNVHKDASTAAQVNFALASTEIAAITAAASGAADVTQEDTCESNDVSNLGWIGCAIIRGIDGVLNTINSQVQTIMQIDLDGNPNDGQVAGSCPGSPTNGTPVAGCAVDALKNAWGAIRNIASILLVLFALLMVLSTAINVGPFDAYTIRKILPRLVAAVILMQLSWSLMIIMIQITNDVGRGISSLMLAPFGGPGVTDLAAVVAQGSAGSGLGFFNGAAAAAVVGGGLALGLVGILSLAFTTFLGILIGFAVLLLRNIVIVAALILAPFAIVCYIVPNTEKVGKFWWDAFSKGLVMFPIIMVLFTSGRIFAWVAANSKSAEAGTFGSPMQFIIIVASYVIPFFLIPATFRLAGGAISTLGGMVNDRSRGVFDRSKKFRQARTQKNVQGMKENNRFSGALLGKDNRFVRGANTGLQYASNAQHAGIKPWKMRRNMETALGDKNYELAKKSLEENEAMRAIRNDDDALWGMMNGKDEKSVRAELLKRAPGRFSDPRVLDDAVARVMRAKREVGGTVGNIAATIAQAGTGTGYNYRDPEDNVDDDMTDAIIRASGDNRSLSGRMLADMKQAAVQSGRYEFGGGFAKSAQIMDQRRTAMGNRQINGAELAERYDSEGRVMYDSNTYNGNELTSNYSQAGNKIMENMSRRDVRRKLMNDAYDSNAGAVIAGKLKTVQNFVPIANDRVDAALQGDATTGMRELANVAGKYDAAAQVAPQNAKAWGDGVMAHQVQVNSLSAEMQKELAPLINQRRPLMGVNGEQARDANDEPLFAESQRASLTVLEMTDYLRDNPVFQQTRREFGRSSVATAQAQMQQQQQSGQNPPVQPINPLPGGGLGGGQI